MEKAQCCFPMDLTLKGFGRIIREMGLENFEILKGNQNLHYIRMVNLWNGLIQSGQVLLRRLLKWKEIDPKNKYIHYH